jgi:hypothetical protein
MPLKFISMMDQKAIVLDLHMRGMGLSPDAIHEHLVHVLEENALAYSTVTKYARSEKFLPMNDGPRSQRMTVEPDPVDEAILTTLANHPFRRCGNSRN